MPEHFRRYIWEFGGSMALYVMFVLGSTLLLLQGVPAVWRLPLSLSPLLPTVLALWAFLRLFRRLDELQRRIQFEALAFSFIVTGFGTFAYGFAENAGLTHVSMIAVFPAMILLWGIGLGIAHKRYA